MTDKNESEKYTIEIGKKAKHKLDILMGRVPRDLYEDGGQTYDEIINYLLWELERSYDWERSSEDPGSDDDITPEDFLKGREKFEKEWKKYD